MPHIIHFNHPLAPVYKSFWLLFHSHSLSKSQTDIHKQNNDLVDSGNHHFEKLFEIISLSSKLFNSEVMVIMIQGSLVVVVK